MHLYGIDTNDPCLYDMVLHIDNMKVNDAVEILGDLARRPCFQTTPKSLAQIRDAFLAAKAHAVIFDRFPAAEVKCRDQVVTVKIETALSLEQEAADTIKSALQPIEQIRDVRVYVVPFDTGD
jgi:hypothetical protein